MEDIKSLERGHKIAIEYSELLTATSGKVAREAIKEKYSISNATLYRYRRIFGAVEPWEKTYKSIVQRCRTERLYVHQGIRCRISVDEIRELWLRDRAEDMESPSIDRIDPRADYVFHNCRFIEIKDNVSRKRHNAGLNLPKPYKDLDFAKRCRQVGSWTGQTEAAKLLGATRPVFGKWCRGDSRPPAYKLESLMESMRKIVREYESK